MNRLLSFRERWHYKTLQFGVGELSTDGGANIRLKNHSYIFLEPLLHKQTYALALLIVKMNHLPQWLQVFRS